MDRAEPRRPRSRATRAKWIVGTSAVAASLVLTGVVAAAGSGSDDPDVPTTTAATAAPAWPPPGAPSLGDTGRARPRDPYQDSDDDDWSNDDDGSDLAPATPSPAPDTSSHGS